MYFLQTLEKNLCPSLKEVTKYAWSNELSRPKWLVADIIFPFRGFDLALSRIGYNKSEEKNLAESKVVRTRSYVTVRPDDMPARGKGLFT